MNDIAKDSVNESSQSRLYTGWVRHRRFVPVSHEFRYPIFMFYLDLDELPSLFSSKWYTSLERFNLVSFRRRDYFQPETECLKQAVIEAAEGSLKQQHITDVSIRSVRMLTHLRLFNFLFNPVTFYYCFDEHENLVCILSEITNTPWDERHHYVLPVNPQGKNRAYPDYSYQPKGRCNHLFEFEKAFHVSPFNPMNMDYRWMFSHPDQVLHVHMENRLSVSDTLNAADQDMTEKHFDATLRLEQRSIDRELSKQLIRQPLMTVKVVAGIYWQAFKLWCKRAPFYDHPKLSQTNHSQQ